ncbi:hypothetical protein LN042_21325 [Kitasatospora sp. RB6PN24]|uniref:hypothetical protein n=1 Tax=Kitasatospora humi TaxID=2893891 RepID=UPI001E65DABD|nr:hypothetical protein [Kitasatospora humi]MCC9309584.1 hypothetical protein [Kitasatospora humi]
MTLLDRLTGASASAGADRARSHEAIGIPTLDAAAGLRKAAQAISAQLDDVHADQALGRARSWATAAVGFGRRTTARTVAFARGQLAGSVRGAHSVADSVRRGTDAGQGTVFTAAARLGTGRRSRAAGVAAVTGGVIAVILWRRRRS